MLCFLTCRPTPNNDRESIIQASKNYMLLIRFIPRKGYCKNSYINVLPVYLFYFVFTSRYLIKTPAKVITDNSINGP